MSMDTVQRTQRQVGRRLLVVNESTQIAQRRGGNCVSDGVRKVSPRGIGTAVPKRRERRVHGFTSIMYICPLAPAKGGLHDVSTIPVEVFFVVAVNSVAIRHATTITITTITAPAIHRLTDWAMAALRGKLTVAISFGFLDKPQ